jgi:pSer/pThr/pTyr-binding forkhead associated (FHA) protein
MNVSDINTHEFHLLLMKEPFYRVIRLSSDFYTIGRDGTNSIVIVGDPISRQHAALQRLEGSGESKYHYRLIDGSTDGKPSRNGVFVNEQRCERQVLESGDMITFGGVIRMMYIRTMMTYLELEQFQDELVSDHPVLSQFADEFVALKVKSYLLAHEPTVIMLGASAASFAKETIVQNFS